MTPNSIKALLGLRGLQYDDVLERMKANGVDVGKDELSKVINGHRSTEKIRKAFAKAIGMSVEELFDDEFSAIAALRRTA